MNTNDETSTHAAELREDLAELLATAEIDSPLYSAEDLREDREALLATAEADDITYAYEPGLDDVDMLDNLDDIDLDRDGDLPKEVTRWMTNYATVCRVSDPTVLCEVAAETFDLDDMLDDADSGIYEWAQAAIAAAQQAR